MLITRKSGSSGIERTLDIPCTREQYQAYVDGEHIQVAMPNVSAADREFIMTGIIQEEWDKLFPEEDDEPTISPYNKPDTL